MMLPARNDIHLWFVQDELEDVDALLACLTPAELQRLERLRVATMRRQFVITRAAIRTVLSGCFPEINAQEWVFSANPWGRPVIVNPEVRGRVSFNIAHTDGLVVIAVSSSGDIGVDVEKTSRTARALALADRYFSAAEATALRALPAALQQRRFIDLWTLKEAYIKACGKGLAIPLRGFSFDFEEEQIQVRFSPEQPDDAGRWQFWQLRAGASHQVGLALAGAGVPVVQLRCPQLHALPVALLGDVAMLRQSFPGQSRMYSSTNLEP